MNRNNLLFLLIILIAFISPSSVFCSSHNYSGISPNANLLAQNNAMDEFEEDLTEEDNKSKKKKKDKDKDKDKAKEDVSLNMDFFLSLLINIITVILIIRFIYYPNYKNQDSLFTFFLFNIIVFVLMYLLNQIKISLGAAFGLFAVFSMLRYRTENITAKEMTYLFIVIAVGLISAVRLDTMELIMINSVIILITYALDGNILFKREYSKLVQYENIELIKPERHLELIEDLKNRTGLKIRRIDIIKMDFLRDTASIKVYYHN